MTIIYRSNDKAAAVPAGWDQNRTTLTVNDVGLDPNDKPKVARSESVCTFVPRKYFVKGTLKLDAEAAKQRTLKTVIEKGIAAGVNEKLNDLHLLFGASAIALQQECSLLQMGLRQVKGADAVQVEQQLEVKEKALAKANEDAQKWKNALSELSWHDKGVDVTNISKFIQEQAIGTATGVAVAPGIVLTARHVVDLMGDCAVVFNLRTDPKGVIPGKCYDIESCVLLGEFTSRPLEVHGVKDLNTKYGTLQRATDNQYWDLALVKLKENEPWPPFAPLDGSLPTAGAKAYGIGSPLGLPLKLTSSAKGLPGPTVRPLEARRLLENPHYSIDMETFKGNSGGPVFSEANTVIGLNVGGRAIEPKETQPSDLDKKLRDMINNYRLQTKSSEKDDLCLDFTRTFDGPFRYDTDTGKVDWYRYRPEECGRYFDVFVNRVDLIAPIVRPFSTFLNAYSVEVQIHITLIEPVPERPGQGSSIHVPDINAYFKNGANARLKCGEITTSNPSGFQVGQILQWSRVVDNAPAATRALGGAVASTQAAIANGDIGPDVFSTAAGLLDLKELVLLSTAEQEGYQPKPSGILRVIFRTRQAIPDGFQFEHSLSFQEDYDAISDDKWGWTTGTLGHKVRASGMPGYWDAFSPCWKGPLPLNNPPIDPIVPQNTNSDKPL